MRPGLDMGQGCQLLVPAWGEDCALDFVTCFRKHALLSPRSVVRRHILAPKSTFPEKLPGCSFLGAPTSTNFSASSVCMASATPSSMASFCSSWLGKSCPFSCLSLVSHNSGVALLITFFFLNIFCSNRALKKKAGCVSFLKKGNQ